MKKTMIPDTSVVQDLPDLAQDRRQDEGHSHQRTLRLRLHLVEVDMIDFIFFNDRFLIDYFHNKDQ